jgi:hypothetical protein
VAAIKKVSKETNREPPIFENPKEHHESKQAFYIEFNVGVQWESGVFFEWILKELRIDRCANNVI